MSYGKSDDGLPVGKKTIVGAVLVVGLLLAAFILPPNLIEWVDAQEIIVIQSIGGTLTVHTEQGPKWQGFGKVTAYRKRQNFNFEKEGDDKDTDPIKIRFNEGGHALISGTISWEPPTAADKLIALHAKYGNQDALEKALVQPVIEKAIYMTGPLMSSKESSSSRRNELISFVEDQVQHGVFRTQVIQEKQTDPITGQLKTVDIVKLVTTPDGRVARAESSPLTEFGVRVWNFSPKSVDYDAVVEAQIQEQQKAVMQVQTAIAMSQKAEQDAKTAAKNGEAEAAKAKWAQEAIKATAVTKGEQELAVATLAKQTAEQIKLEQILLGQGEAERRRLVMQADGALDKKLATYQAVMERWAQAAENIKQPLVPTTVIGTQGGGAANGIELMMQLLAAKTAKDLSLEVRPKQ